MSNATFKAFQLRLPPELYARLRETAWTRRLSMHQCALEALDSWLEPAENETAQQR